MGLTLACFPHAGGAATLFHRWPSLLPPSVRVVGIEPPGRGLRFTEEPLDDWDVIVRDAIEQLSLCGALAGTKLALFGHSMGAHVAYEVACALARRTPPVHLFVAGQTAPDSTFEDPPLSHLADAAFLEELRRRGGISDEVLANRELVELFLPILRADFRAYEGFERRSRPAIPTSITALGATEDVTVPLEELDGWQRHTHGRFAKHVLVGDHFFVRAAQEEVVGIVSRELARSSTDA
jgi:medium-chain acyl-[acyl-carrier-protein] hydrolase